MLLLLSLCLASRPHTDALWALLKKPGHLVLLRHSNA
jgi:hypothetical protein